MHYIKPFALKVFIKFVFVFTAQRMCSEALEGTEDHYYNYEFSNYSDLEQFTPLPPSDSAEDNDTISGESEDVCFVDGMLTGHGMVAVGCTMHCSINGTVPLTDTTPCIVYTQEEFKNITPYENLTCPLGSCIDGVCESFSRCTWCWKHKISLIPASI